MTDSKETFVARVGCMDDREAEAVRRYARENKLGFYVDNIDDPGMVKRLAEGDERALAILRERLPISVGKHGAQHVIVSGHGECAGNPVGKEEHIRHIHRAAEIVEAFLEEIGYGHIPIIKLYAEPDQQRVWTATPLEEPVAAAA